MASGSFDPRVRGVARNLFGGIKVKHKAIAVLASFLPHKSLLGLILGYIYPIYPRRYAPAQSHQESVWGD